ncbi:FkbM family methyltransferase [Flammeovirga pectinis]|uniref:FkbM family methyltransferase n=1 Tax=Flammeovirga pectinis TaxID=2494373 RepID=A0A3S9P5X8_9BACT|nr:FkbM family methyltransferase [Flammeovirga pectinis]AZQ63514.1 FkbM family methyltransferase [Flammeovirga pectinis]
MNYKENKQIYKKVTDKGIELRCICEVGVYYPETSNILDFINNGIKTILVEPSADSLKRIDEYFSDKSNIIIHKVAVADKNGSLKLAKANASTFITDLPKSPALINDLYTIKESDTFTVPCVTFDKIDSGDIDLLSIDIEGAEWYVLKNLKSLPKIISVETHGKFYTNPFIKEINQWIEKNNYKIWYKNNSDTVYYRDDVIELSIKENLNLKFIELKLFLRHSKRYLLWPYYKMKGY